MSSVCVPCRIKTATRPALVMLQNECRLLAGINDALVLDAKQ